MNYEEAVAQWLLTKSAKAFREHPDLAKTKVYVDAEDGQVYSTYTADPAIANIKGDFYSAGGDYLGEIEVDVTRTPFGDLLREILG